MIRATLEFELPEDQNEFTMATKGHQYFSCLFDIGQELRRYRKYEELTPSERRIIEKLEEFFYDTVGGLIEEVE